MDRPGNQDDTGRRETIIAAAADLFSERGFAGASNREIARAAGISPGLIYWYFRDKDELFMHVLEHLFPLQRLEIPTRSADEMSVEELLQEVGRQFITIMTRQDAQRLMRLSLSELIRFPDLRRRVGEMMARAAIFRLAEELDLRVERGEIAPVNTRLAAQSFFGSLVGFILRRYLFDSPDLEDTTGEEMVRVVVSIHAAGLRQN